MAGFSPPQLPPPLLVTFPEPVLPKDSDTECLFNAYVGRVCPKAQDKGRPGSFTMRPQV